MYTALLASTIPAAYQWPRNNCSKLTPKLARQSGAPRSRNDQRLRENVRRNDRARTLANYLEGLASGVVNCTSFPHPRKGWSTSPPSGERWTSERDSRRSKADCHYPQSVISRKHWQDYDAHRTIFTDAAYALIRAWVAENVPAEHIAQRLGCKVSSLRVQCCHRKSVCAHLIGLSAARRN